METDVLSGYTLCPISLSCLGQAMEALYMPFVRCDAIIHDRGRLAVVSRLLV